MIWRDLFNSRVGITSFSTGRKKGGSWEDKCSNGSNADFPTSCLCRLICFITIIMFSVEHGITRFSVPRWLTHFDTLKSYSSFSLCFDIWPRVAIISRKSDYFEEWPWQSPYYIFIVLGISHFVRLKIKTLVLSLNFTGKQPCKKSQKCDVFPLDG